MLLGIMNPNSSFKHAAYYYTTCIDYHKLRKQRLPLLLTHTRRAALYSHSRGIGSLMHLNRIPQKETHCLIDWPAPINNRRHKRSRISLERVSITIYKHQPWGYMSKSVHLAKRSSIHSSVSHWVFFLIRHDRYVTSPACVWSSDRCNYPHPMNYPVAN
jgi:hypothetical protein